MPEKDSWGGRDVKNDGWKGSEGGAKTLIHRSWVVWQTSRHVTRSKANPLPCSFLFLWPSLPFHNYTHSDFFTEVMFVSFRFTSYNKSLAVQNHGMKYFCIVFVWSGRKGRKAGWEKQEVPKGTGDEQIKKRRSYRSGHVWSSLIGTFKGKMFSVLLFLGAGNDSQRLISHLSLLANGPLVNVGYT